MLAKNIADSFCKEGIVSKEEQAIVQFGLECLGGDIAGIILTLTVGACFNHIEIALLLWWFLFPLKINAGGYHAKTKIRCLLTTFIELIAAFWIFTLHEFSTIFYVLAIINLGCLIWFLAPVDNKSKELDAIERKVYRIRTRVVLCTEILLFSVNLILGWKNVTQSILMAFFIVAISLLLGKLTNVRITKNYLEVE